jgi:hypothetical protein
MRRDTLLHHLKFPGRKDCSFFMGPVVLRSWFAGEVTTRDEEIAGFAMESRELDVTLDDSGCDA